jgi:predicted NAD/FAD-binding protein
MSRIAVIGSGISGLAAAYYLSRRHDVFLFEKEARLGGHTHTVTIESSAGPLGIDTGFIVHNDRTYPNLVRLLADASLLPRRHWAQASWNYHLEPKARNSAMLTYNMNRLQSLAVKERYCATLNADGSIDPSKVLRKLVYHHPLYTRAAIRAQARWAEISGKNRTHYCGAYWFYGFHEDGLNSARRVASSLGINL